MTTTVTESGKAHIQVGVSMVLRTERGTFVADSTDPLVSSRRKRGYRGQYVDSDGVVKPAIALVFDAQDPRFYGGEVAALSRNSLIGVGPQVFELVQSVEFDDAVHPVVVEEDAGENLEFVLFDGAVVPGLPGEDWDAPLSAVGTETRSKENQKILFDLLVQLSNMHANGIYHRDVRAANVCVRRFGANPADIHATLIDHELATEYEGTEISASARSYERLLFEVLPVRERGGVASATEPSSLERDLGYFAGLRYELESGKRLEAAEAGWLDVRVPDLQPERGSGGSAGKRKGKLGAARRRVKTGAGGDVGVGVGGKTRARRFGHKSAASQKAIPLFSYGEDGSVQVRDIDFETDIRPLAESLGLHSIETDHQFDADQLAAIRAHVKHGGYVDAHDMRMIAPLSGMGFEELDERRDQKRRSVIKRAGIVAGSVLAVLLLVIVVLQVLVAVNASSSQQNQAENLAKESASLLEKGDRLQAVQVAQAALPTGGILGSPDVSPTVQNALEQALEVYPTDASRFYPSYSIEGQSDTSTIALDMQCDRLVTWDSAKQLSVYTISTGELVRTITLDDVLLASANTTNRASMSFGEGGGFLAEPAFCTGGVIVTRMSNGYSAFIGISDSDELVVSVFSRHPMTNCVYSSYAGYFAFTAKSGDSKTGEYALVSENMSTGATVSTLIEDDPSSECFQMDPQGKNIYVAVGKKLYKMNLSSGKVKSVKLEGGRAEGITVMNKQVLVTTMGKNGKGGIASYDSGLNKQWSRSLSWGDHTDDTRESPKVTWACYTESGDEFTEGCVSFGNQCEFFDASTGKVNARKYFKSPVVGGFYYEMDRPFGCLVLGSGKIVRFDELDSGTTFTNYGQIGSDEEFSLARIGVYSTGVTIAAISSDKADRAVVYQAQTAAQFDGVEELDSSFLAPKKNCDGTKLYSKPQTSDDQSAYFGGLRNTSSGSRLKTLAKLPAPTTLEMYDPNTFEHVDTLNLADYGIELTASINVAYSPSTTDPDIVYIVDCGNESTPARVWAVDSEKKKLVASWSDDAWQKGDSSDDVTMEQTSEGCLNVRTGKDGCRLSVLDAATLEQMGRFDAAAEDAVTRVYDFGSCYLAFDGDGIGRFFRDFADIANPDAVVDGSATVSRGNNAINVSQDGSFMVVAAESGKLKAISLETCKQLWSIGLYPYEGVKTYLTKDGRRLIVQDAQGDLHLLDATTGVELSSYSVPNDRGVVSIEFSQDGKLAYCVLVSAGKSSGASASASDTGNSTYVMHVLSLDGDQLALRSKVACASMVASDEQHVLLVTSNGTYRAKLYSLDELKEKAEAITEGHELTDEEKAQYGLG